MRRAWVRSGMIVAAAAAVTIMAGCGGGGSSKSDATPTTAAGDVSLPDGAGSEDFCGLVKTYGARLAGLSQASSTPDQIRSLAQDLTSALKSAVDVAPAELKADVAALTGAADDYLGQLKDAGYDLSKLPPDAAQAFQAPDVAAAADRVQTYAVNVCGARS